MGQRLGPLDVNFWTIHSETTPQVIASYFPLDVEPDLEAVRGAFLEQLVQYPRFRQRVVKGFRLRWEDDPGFDIAYHVRPVRFAVDTPEALAQSVENCFSAPLDISRPPWEFIVLTGTGANPPAGVMFRVHHALADGLGALDFFHRVCRTERLAADGEGKLSGGAISNRSTKTPARVGVDFWKSIRRLAADSGEKAVRSALNGPNSNERRLDFLELSMDELRPLRRKLGASLNDVLLSLVAGAVGKYQDFREAPIESVKILLPFSLRRRRDEMTLGNNITGVGVDLPVSLRDPFERVERIRSAITRMKIDGSIGAFRILGVINAYLPARLRRRVGDAAARRTNFICTNMPGPEEPLYLCGSKLLANFGCAALLRGHGVAFGFISYAGKMCIAIVSDPAIVPDSPQLVRYFLDALDELRQAAAGEQYAAQAAS